MIEYDVEKWFGFHVVFSMMGSVLPQAVIPTTVSCLVAVLVLIEPDRDDSGRTEVFRSYLSHPYPHQITSVMIGFMMVFRVQLSYSRYWEGIGALTDMYTKWYDAAVQVCAFDELSEGEAAKTGAAFRQHAVHLFSLMSTCSLIELKQENLSVFTRPQQPPRTREWPLLRQILAMPPPDPDYAGKDAIEVHGGLLEEEAEHLANHEPHFVDCALSRLVRLISVRFQEKGLNMPPPIVSRIYQELSNGALGFHQAQKIARVPFPFPYAQLLSIMKLYFMVTVPLAVVCFTNDYAFAIFMSGFTSFIFVCLNGVAIELEDPFGNDANDLPLQQMHQSFNRALEHLLHVDAPKGDTQKGAQCMKLQSSIRTTVKRGGAALAAAAAAAASQGQ